VTLQVALNHQTRYCYDRAVAHSPQVIRLRPAPHNRTPILAYSLKVSPQPHFLNWLQDPQGNWQARVVFREKVDRFEVIVDLVADLTPYNAFDFFVEDYAEQQPFTYAPALERELEPFFDTLPVTPRLADYLANIDRTPGDVIPYLFRLNHQLQEHIAYLIRLEPGVQSPEETLEKGSGSCRDTAWLLVQLLRHLGYAARFVSGYLIQLKADVKPLEGPPGPAEDFTDLHAWCEVYLPGAGWVGLDPTSGLFAAEGHIPLAATPSPISAAPITGTTDTCEVDFAHSMAVERIAESPRVTLPYSEQQWQAVDALGEQIDKRLEQDDMRLTMGGEPTFVSIDNMDGDEWNTVALGEQKRQLAGNLVRELKQEFAPGSLTLVGQGKWYPGEPLPRWSDYIYWRNDGEPLWEGKEEENTTSAPLSVTQGEQLLQTIAEQLGVNAGHVMTAYEDPWHLLHQEQQLPLDWQEHDTRLDDMGERARLMASLQRGLDCPAGYVLPLQPWQGRAWRSCRWPLRSERLYLLPGDSPLGLRLPLHSLPGQQDPERPPWFAQDPMAPRDPLDPRTGAPHTAAASGESFSHPRQPVSLTPLVPADPVLQVRGQGEFSTVSATEEPLIITALCVEPRDERLGVFLPPVPDTEAFLALLSAIENASQTLRLPVQIEGYPPPSDHRLPHICVAPDPGVIEVNIHPAHNWANLRDNTVKLYDAARRARLSTEKFDLDGRHVGTGGGNHLVVGGATPVDSPFLRRPDLLGSLIRYWQHHPSLSYLFASQFIGPTSQAPRVDEARDDALYELEIALQQLPQRGETAPPWLVDRVLRHLLTDITGNTHRAEICIDKLYSPDSASGRLGLVEFRSFEMPPHPRMSLVQQLLLRGLLSWFWRQPYTRTPIHWGTALHDRFMLPHFLQQDLAQVIDELRDAGMAFERDWFAPHLEFRCPRLGQITCEAVPAEGVTISLRRALEPWLTLGEETTSSGTARYVDSSLERLQVKVRQFIPERYRVTCNGRALPLTATGRAGEYVAGVRYRAWQPPSCLHPTIPVNTPLVFDLVDTWSGRAIGGCTWHVAHPGGRHHERFPVNAREAQSRRAALFKPFGHTPGPLEVEVPPPNPAMPTTLDLRWYRVS